MIPSSIVFLVVKLRVSPRGGSSAPSQEKDVNETKRIIKVNEERDQQFLISKKEVEELSGAAGSSGLAHAPYWPGVRFIAIEMLGCCSLCSFGTVPQTILVAGDR